MSSFVLDNSISAAWCFQDQSTDYTEAVLGSLIAGAEAIVPAIWKLELANALVAAERRKKIAPEKSARFLRDLQQFAISMDLEGLARAVRPSLPAEDVGDARARGTKRHRRCGDKAWRVQGQSRKHTQDPPRHLAFRLSNPDPSQ